MSNNLTDSPAWQALQAHQTEMRDTHMRDLFAGSPERSAKHEVTCGDLVFNYARNKINDKTLGLLTDLAQQQDLADWRDKMFSGAALNTTENRAVRHADMRDPNSSDDVVKQTHDMLQHFAAEYNADNNITDIVHIGIGGSDLGPRLVYKTLKAQQKTFKTLHFVSNVDPLELSGVLQHLKPESTLFVVASKTFTTLETLTNAQSAKDWLVQHKGEKAVAKHFLAITGQPDKAQQFGITADHILPLPDWVGGRYSLWSAIGLPLCLTFGYEVFAELLKGAYEADTHFRDAPFDQNIPVLMALLSIWYRNFWDYRAQAVLPYDERLKYLPVYLQQLDMESNGKSVSRDGKAITHATSPVIFGEPGTNGQHAFYQMLHQGGDIIPCDFIFCADKSGDLPGHHKKLVANALGQAQALMLGRENDTEPHKNFPGNRPSNTLMLRRLTPQTLGLLLAIYEHKIITQGIIWGINSFDQWGVELGKTLARDVLSHLEDATTDNLDDLTLRMLKHFQSEHA